MSLESTWRAGHRALTLILSVMILLALLVPSPVHAAQAVILDGSALRVPLGLQTDILEDPSALLGPEQVTAPDTAARFVPSTKAIPGFGFSTSATWMRWRVCSTLPRPCLTAMRRVPVARSVSAPKSPRQRPDDAWL